MTFPTFLFSCVALTFVLVEIECAQLTPSEQQEILDKHNEYRRQVAKGEVTDKNGFRLPPAADMTKLQWDQELADQTNTYLATCRGVRLEHDPALDETDIGECWDWHPSRLTAIQTVDDWFGEITKNGISCRDLTFTWNGCDAYGMIGHFTQVAWANTWKIGCAKTSMNECGRGQLYFCRYFKGGNFERAKIYTEGRTASQCGSQQRAEDGLCVGPPGDGSGSQQTKNNEWQDTASNRLQNTQNRWQTTQRYNYRQVKPKNDCKDVFEEYHCVRFRKEKSCYSQSADYLVKWMKEKCRKTCGFC